MTLMQRNGDFGNGCALGFCYDNDYRHDIKGQLFGDQ